MLVLMCCYGGWSLSCQGNRCKQARELEEAVWGKDVVPLTEIREADKGQVYGKDDEANLLFNILT